MSKKIKNSSLLLNNWIDDTAQALVEDVLKHMEAVTGNHHDKEDILVLMVSKFLESYVGAIIYGSLTIYNDSDMSKKERYRLTHVNFTKMKTAVQQSVSLGFERAAERYSGLKMDYWCDIKPVGDPINKEPI